MYLREMRYEDVNRFNYFRVVPQKRAFVNTVMNLRVP